MVRDNGFYSNVSRGKRKKQDHDDLIPSILEPDGSSKEHRNNWARLIQKIYELDLLTCPKCQGRSKIPSLAGMRILAFIENDQLIKKILKHLGLGSEGKAPATGQPISTEHPYRLFRFSGSNFRGLSLLRSGLPH